MERIDVFLKLQEIVCDVLNLDEVKLTNESSANDYEEWDSINHIQIISDIQDYFGIKFSAREMLTWNNVGDIVDAILSKI